MNHGIPVSPHPHQYLLFSAFSDNNILLDVKLYLIADIICAFQGISDVQHLFCVFIGHLKILFGKCGLTFCVNYEDKKEA